MTDKQNPPNAMDVFKIAALVSGAGLVALTAALFWYLFGPQQVTVEEQTRNTITQVAQALAHYRAGCHVLPTTEQGLQALLTPPPRGPLCAEVPSVILEAIPPDSWGHSFIYVSDGKEFTLTSLGRDGKPGGEGTDADIVYRGTP